MIAKRVFYNFIIFISIALLPWPVYSALLIAGIFLFKNFLESLLWLLIVVMLFSPGSIGLLDNRYVLVMIILLALVAYIKKIMRWYE